MKTYIVLDLEWNQSASGKKDRIEAMPFEIIEIGAVKMNEDFKLIDEFSRVIRPVVYPKLHYKVHEIMHIGIKELKKRGETFTYVINDFMKWCFGNNQEPIFCTWGSMDITELQRNMAYYHIKNSFAYPLLYYDVQKMFSLLYQSENKDKFPLDRAVEAMHIEETRPFHRAADDAYYAGRILADMDFEKVKQYLSLDYYRIPENEQEEIYLVFPNYSKYVSRAFASKEIALENKTVTDMLCYRCNRMLRKKIRWFFVNQRIGYCLASCPEHGFVKGKIRVKQSESGGFFIVKTIKLINSETASELCERKEELARKRNLKNKLKKKKKEIDFQSV